MATGGPFIHPTSIVDDGADIGDGAKIWHFSHVLTRTSIGANTVLGQNCVVGPDVTVGSGCRIQNNVSLYKGVTLKDDVFCGPSCVFTNVVTPRAFVSRKHDFRDTKVERGVSIGANATIICGNTLGEYSLVGAGAVVTKDVAAHSIVVGNPAKHVGWACTCGAKLTIGRLDTACLCRECGRKWIQVDVMALEEIEEDNSSEA